MARLQQEVSQPASSAGGMTPVGRRFTQYPLPAGPDVRVKITEEIRK